MTAMDIFERTARDTLSRLSAPLVAIDAAWDGDKTGWFIDLCAVVEQPGGKMEVYLAEFDDKSERERIFKSLKG